MVEDIRAGASLALSGRLAPQGRQSARGLRLWAERANLAGGLSTPRGLRGVRLILLDDESRPDVARGCYGRLLEQERPELLFGPYGSHLVLAVAPLAEAAGLVLWNHGGSTDALGTLGLRHLVSLPGPAGRYFHGVLELVATRTPRSRRLALLHAARGTFAAAIAAGTERHAHELDFEAVLRDSYPADLAGFDSLAARVAAARPDVILAAGDFDSDVAFVRALRRADVRTSWIAVVAAGVGAFGLALEAASEGVIGPSQWEPGLRLIPDLGPGAAELDRLYRARWGVPPDYPAAQAFAAGLIAQRCLELADSADQEALRAAATTLDLATCYGRFRLDPSGHQVGHQLLQVQWRAGRRRIVWPAELAEAAPAPLRPRR